ncbi:hypothetical protein TcWFU_001953 [Taenia crassiceps]|uniref:Uncharacterized protein n=1 Tax=Taenia crassiceps TaxID=6207 RepID=A0ABR4Q0Q2_9CEST
METQVLEEVASISKSLKPPERHNAPLHDLQVAYHKLEEEVEVGRRGVVGSMEGSGVQTDLHSVVLRKSSTRPVRQVMPQATARSFCTVPLHVSSRGGRPGRPLLPMQVSDIHTIAGFPKEVKTVLWTFSTAIVLILSVTLVFVLRMRNRARRYLHYQVRWNRVLEAMSGGRLANTTTQSEGGKNMEVHGIALPCFTPSQSSWCAVVPSVEHKNGTYYRKYLVSCHLLRELQEIRSLKGFL